METADKNSFTMPLRCRRLWYHGRTYHVSAHQLFEVKVALKSVGAVYLHLMANQDTFIGYSVWGQGTSKLSPDERRPRCVVVPRAEVGSLVHFFRDYEPSLDMYNFFPQWFLSQPVPWAPPPKKRESILGGIGYFPKFEETLSNAEYQTWVEQKHGRQEVPSAKEYIRELLTNNPEPAVEKVCHLRTIEKIYGTVEEQ